jgi:GT2 family glycosyltransferase
MSDLPRMPQPPSGWSDCRDRPARPVHAGEEARPRVTVVICAYTERRWSQVQAAVDSVLRQQTPPDQVVLVIDHNPALLQRTREAYPRLTVVANSGPRGLSGARNTGVSQAHGVVIAFLDDDAVAEPDWLARMLVHYDDPRVLAVGGSAAPDGPDARPRWFPPEFDWVVGCSFIGQPSQAAPVRNLIGCNMSFRRSALDEAGRFDPALGRVGGVPVGCEETELCIRLRQRRPDGVVLYEPAARVRHHVSDDRWTWTYFRHRCFSEGRSKAVVARLVGSDAGLSTEREYSRRVLPRGVRRGLLEVRAGRDLSGLLRSAAIVAGLAITATGYLSCRVDRRRPRPSVANSAIPSIKDGAPDAVVRTPLGPPTDRRKVPGPVRVLSVELADGVPAMAADGARYEAAQVLVRLHGQPLGVIRVTLPTVGLTADQHAAAIYQQLAEPIGRHLKQDGLAQVATLTTEGLGWAVPCAVRRPLPPTAPPVTVVVPTCGRPDILRRSIEALTCLDYPKYELLVVDNMPHLPTTAEVVATYAASDPRVCYLAEPRRGVSHARNRGLAAAKGEIVAFADDDVVVEPEWLAALVAGFTDDQVAGVTGMVLASELETPPQLWIEQYGGFGKGCARRRFERTGIDTEEGDERQHMAAAQRSLYPYSPGIFGSGANMAFRTDVVRRLGGFDRRLGSGVATRSGEDIDLLLRVVLDGKAIMYEPAAVVWHRHKRDRRALRRTMYAYGVGLSAVITKTVLSNQVASRELLRRLPGGIAYAVNPNSAKNSGKTAGYPRSLTALELLGMVAGPICYVADAYGSRVLHRRARAGLEVQS